MLNYKGGNKTKGGFYWKKGEWEIVTVEGKTGMLPGGNECQYMRIPGILFVPLSVILGGLFVIFLPFIGFAMLFGMVAVKAAELSSVAAHALAERLAESPLLARMPLPRLAMVLGLTAKPGKGLGRGLRGHTEG